MSSYNERRDMFAAAALQGLLANSTVYTSALAVQRARGQSGYEILAKEATDAADALLAAVDATKSESASVSPSWILDMLDLERQGLVKP